MASGCFGWIEIPSSERATLAILSKSSIFRNSALKSLVAPGYADGNFISITSNVNFHYMETEFPSIRAISRTHLPVGRQMCDDFLRVRLKFAAPDVSVVEPFEWPGAVPSACFNNVRQIVAQFGGSFAYGWALSSLGPAVSTERKIRPLYCRWVNHVLWRDNEGQAWEVTPDRNESDPGKLAWKSAYFLPDDEAEFEIVSDEFCQPKPTVYVALRPEGEWTADCLCQAERAPREMQDRWFERALSSLTQAGFVPIDCRVERAGGFILNVWLLAE